VVPLESSVLAAARPDGSGGVVGTAAWLDPNGNE
jgi:hypothetical protein